MRYSIAVMLHEGMNRLMETKLMHITTIRQNTEHMKKFMTLCATPQCHAAYEQLACGSVALCKNTALCTTSRFLAGLEYGRVNVPHKLHSRAPKNNVPLIILLHSHAASMVGACNRYRGLAARALVADKLDEWNSRNRPAGYQSRHLRLPGRK